MAQDSNVEVECPHHPAQPLGLILLPATQQDLVLTPDLANCWVWCRPVQQGIVYSRALWSKQFLHKKYY